MGVACGGEKSDGRKGKDGQDGRHVELKIAVVLRSRRSATYEDDVQVLLLCLLSVVGIDVEGEESRVVRRRYIGDQRCNEQIQFEGVKNAIQCVIVIELTANNKECEAILKNKGTQICHCEVDCSQ